MRVHNRQDFMKLPAGAAFAKGKPWFFDGLQFKGDTIQNDRGENIDWYVLDLTWVDGQNSGECFTRLDEMLDEGKSYPVQNSICRDGCFDDEDLFLVFERDDLELLKTQVDAALSVCA